ncbi:hypothetical protein [Halofilum ochraceum]|uniref:hypothetical protein n=1 Tax=Halofilum ochraceum TaxID=1611323 RepID=UPI0008DA9141|nr:hypothetical protein [Halofilum ochraceum]
MDEDKNLRAAHELIATLHSQSVSYTNLIMVVGYAGFLTLWSKLKPDLPPILFSTTGLLIGTSILLFIVWELVKMVGGQMELRRLRSSLVGSQSPPEAIQRFHYQLQKYGTGWVNLWLWFFVPTLATGIAAALALLGFFAFKLIEYGF